jgi:hypothetical protein
MYSPIVIAAASIGSALATSGVWLFLTEVFKIGSAKRKDELESLRISHAECEKKYKELETRLEALEHSRDSQFARWIKDRNGCIVWMNSKAYLMLFAPLGYSREELTAKTFRQLFDPGVGAEIEALDYAALTNSGVAQPILIQLHPNLPFLNIVKVAYSGASGEVQYEGIAYQPGDPEIRHAAGVKRQVQQLTASASHIIDNEEPPAPAE